MADSKKYDGSQWEHSLRKQTTATEAVENPLYSDGTAITAYTLKGNTVQDGTPTPSNPVEVNGVGVRTKNLLKNDAVSTEFRGVQYTVNADKSVTVYGTASQQVSYLILMGDGAATNNLNAYTTPIFKAGDTLNFTTSSSIKLQGRNTDGTYAEVSNGSVTLSKDLGLIYIQVVVGAPADETVYPMITLSTETNTDYEPHGYKIPISNGGVTTNIYLNEPLNKIGDYADTIGADGTVTRKIKKIILTGSETDWSVIHSGTANQYFMLPVSKAIQNNELCTHFIKNGVYDGNTNVGIIVIGDGAIRIRPENVATISLTDFKTWLVGQYANGTPVTVWYVLATAETETVTAPSIPTTEGANSITVDTTVQPSEFTATWTGWHNASVKEWDGSDWQ